MRRHAALLIAAIWTVLACAGTAEAACRQALALGLDVSGSVDPREYRLQLDGLAGALENPEVQAALFAMPAAPVRIAVFEWSGPKDQRLTLPWTVIDSPAALATATATLRATTRGPGDPSTAIGAAELYGAGLLGQAEGCWKRTLDLSGDGKSNTGPEPRNISRQSLGEITVNGLVVGDSPESVGDRRQADIAELSAYYRAWVIKGPDAFVEAALGFEDFEAAMVRKLKRELEGLVLSRAAP